MAAPQASSSDRDLESALAAYGDGAWKDACAAFAAAEAGGSRLSAEDLDRYGNAELFSGEPNPTILERAFEAYEHGGQVHEAARVAIDLAAIHAVRGKSSLAMGWGRRAERVLEGHPEGPGHAHVVGLLGLFATFAGRISEALELAERSHALARAHGNHDAEANALNRRARLLLRQGRVEEAKADLDEAMLLVHSGRVRPLAGAMIYCNTIDACRDMSDYERALEWTEAATTWITERGVWCFPGVCRVHRAELLRLRGEHGRAHREVEAAIEVFERMRAHGVVGEAFAELGLQRLETGDLEGAEEAFRSAQDVGIEPQPGLALTRLRRGDPKGARTMLHGALHERDDNRLGRALLLPSLVEVALVLGDIAEARQAADELEQTASRTGTIGLRAAASMAAARVHIAAEEAQPALVRAREAKRAWNMIGARYELIRARELLAEAYALVGDEARATLERAAARGDRDALESGSRTDFAGDPDVTRDANDRPPTFTSSPTIVEGTTIDGKIDVGPVLGVGGMGIVHGGRHRLTGRDVAIKVLKHSAWADEQRCVRFLQEALACGRIRHPNVVDIYDAGRLGREPYLVMERLSGEPLSDRIERKPRLEVAEALTIAEQAACGVAAAHAAGIVHRDLKPANVFVDVASDGAVATKVLDFGLSMLAEDGSPASEEMVGTPFYMAPEQIHSPTEVDARTDVYALGAVLFEMLTGRPPFVADSLTALLAEITVGDPPDLASQRPDLPASLVTLVECALAREPKVRYASMEDLASALARAH